MKIFAKYVVNSKYFLSKDNDFAKKIANSNLIREKDSEFKVY